MTCLTAENFYEEGLPPAGDPSWTRLLTRSAETPARYFKLICQGP